MKRSKLLRNTFSTSPLIPKSKACKSKEYVVRNINIFNNTIMNIGRLVSRELRVLVTPEEIGKEI